MNKLIIIILLIVPALLNANPIPVGLSIWELYFDESGEWTLEVIDPEGYIFEFIDYLELECINGNAYIESIDSAKYIVVTNSDLSNQLTINKDSDLIKLTSYGLGGYSEVIAIGNYEGSYLKNINYGQSIARFYEYGPFYIDNSPTIGSENDFEGTLGKIYGYFHDESGELLTNKYFFINEGYCTAVLQKQGIMEGCIEINDTGFYCAEITARSYKFTERDIYTSPSDNEKMYFDNVEFDLHEGDSININFIGRTTSKVPVAKDHVKLYNYPNPADDHTFFIFDLPESYSLESVSIRIYDLTGRKVEIINPVSTEHKWDCSKLKPGNYIYTLSYNNQPLNSNELVILR